MAENSEDKQKVTNSNQEENAVADELQLDKEATRPVSGTGGANKGEASEELPSPGIPHIIDADHA